MVESTIADILGLFQLEMKANCFNQRSTVVDSTRILLAPRVETAIVESTIADILGLFQPEIN